MFLGGVGRLMRALASGTTFSPIDLFASGAPGVWYDPSDLTTMFQDAAGTTPVTAVEQPVGLRLDKSRNGVGTNGAKRVNLLSWSEAFDNAAWSKGGSAVVAADATVAPNLTLTADKVTAGSADSFVFQTPTLQAGVSYRFSVYIKAGSASSIRLYSVYGSPAFTACSLTSGWQLFTHTFTPTATTGNIQIGGGSSFSTGDIFIWGADLRLASEASTLPTYQPITASWRDTIPGSHAFQTTDINRPVLSARINILERTEQFNNAYWTKAGGSVSGTTFTEDTATTFHNVYRNSGITASTSHTLSVRLKAGTRRYVTVGCEASGNSAFLIVDTTNFSYTTKTTGTGAISAHSVTADGDGWYRASIAFTNAGAFIQVCSSDTANPSVINPSFTGNGSTILLDRIDLRVSNDGVGLPAYQRVTTATDYDTTGFPLYLRYNGTNSTMQTAAIDFSSTDKMSVFAGVRKLSDAASAMVVQLSATDTNAGMFLLVAPGSNGANSYRFASRGSSSFSGATDTAQTSNTFPAPDTAVIAGLADIAGDSQVLRRNGTQVATNTTFDQGTGKYGNHPLYLGVAYNNPPTTPSALFFNGRDYGICVLGRTATAAEISSMESWLNAKTGAY